MPFDAGKLYIYNGGGSIVMASSSREDIIHQFTDLLARVSDKQDINLYASTAIINVIRRLRSRRDLTFFKNINNDRV
ncbi:hypothetical protein PRIPAC_92718 [Pristionchus pacificus]|uniref:Uncharacterized protein n=1 Tax=Pristionchus pacificus TaxID=54126 RepID=A0A2A6BJ81_PRIPA|nr:hypothetical protein PRIPAC_92718 [Pristionchus pacificus]|eukprot:PDM65970.1 hypothetical protein PRIPAC_44249 [Pristionchus pacificus]